MFFIPLLLICFTFFANMHLFFVQQVYDGVYDSLLYYLEGSVEQHLEILSESHEMDVYFRSDGSVTYSGFVLRYSVEGDEDGGSGSGSGSG